MKSLLLRTAARLILPLLLLFSLFLLFRGHDEPGGGFVGGVIAAAALALNALAYGAAETRRLLRVAPSLICAFGLLVASAAGLPGLVSRGNYLEAWWGMKVQGLGKLGTPMLFDAGIYLVVVGGILLMFLPLMEEAR